MSTPSIAHSDGLRSDQIRAGFSFDLDDEDCLVVRLNGLFFARYGKYTPGRIIHQEIDNAIELRKAVTMAPFKAEDFEAAR